MLFTNSSQIQRLRSARCVLTFQRNAENNSRACLSRIRGLCCQRTEASLFRLATSRKFAFK
jgi:hypothetical protein